MCVVCGECRQGSPKRQILFFENKATMILIAVSGSTYTDWVFVENGQIVSREKTEGFNPYFQTRKEISRIIRLGLPEECFKRKLQQIYFYGAGCSNDAKKKIVSQSLISQFKTPAIVESDLLAAARGLCIDKWGIACILDTGSNSCLYNGREIVENVKSCGYILGDEGSGSYLGKTFLSDVLKKLAPEELCAAFYTRLNTTPNEIMTAVYDMPLPHYYLSSLSFFLADYQENEYVRNLLSKSFRTFMLRNVCQYKYQQYPIYFTGSIASTYFSILKEVCQEIGVRPARIEDTVIYGLITYHSKY